jgi:AcrR family transcriptional regulator
VTGSIATELPADSDARRRILEAAYDLFSRRGVRGVGIDEVVRRAEVAKATLYRHFPSKDELAVAFLQEREERWTREWLEAEARRRGSTPEERLLAIFDVFDGWFHETDFEGCSFINVLAEDSDRENAVALACATHLENIRGILRRFAAEAGIEDVDDFARTWHILMKGSIVSAMEGDAEAAQRAKNVGRLVLAHFRLAAPPAGRVAVAHSLVE